jgi:hemerythrin superfamily protein
VNGNTSQLQNMLKDNMIKADERAAKQDERFETLMQTLLTHMNKGDG